MASVGASALEVPQTVLRIAGACTAVRAGCRFGGRELVFQSALEAELQSMSIATRRELVTPVLYRGVPLGHDVRGREDLVALDDGAHIIIEIKQARRLEPKDFMQLYRYLENRRGAPAVHGVLVLFGDVHDEAWYVRLDDDGCVHRAELFRVPVEPPSVVTYDSYARSLDV
jgi:GxxExxY protein